MKKLEAFRALSVDEAEALLAPYQAKFDAPGPRVGMDVDPELFTDGARLYGTTHVEGDLDNPRSEPAPRLVDGDLTVDGVLTNDEGALFVTGDLRARAICNSGYLVVMGKITTERFFGAHERWGTHAFGGFEAKEVALYHQHYVDAVLVVARIADDEVEGSEAVNAMLRSWGATYDGDAGPTLEGVAAALKRA